MPSSLPTSSPSNAPSNIPSLPPTNPPSGSCSLPDVTPWYVISTDSSGCPDVKGETIGPLEEMTVILRDPDLPTSGQQIDKGKILGSVYSTFSF